MKHDTQEKNQNSFHGKLRLKMDEYAHLIYKVTKKFPKDELFGITSQLRRSGLSVVLNYIEGYARIREKVHRHFLNISYGSLKESKYLLHFSFKEGYLEENDFKKLLELSNEIGAMLWGMLQNIKE